MKRLSLAAPLAGLMIALVACGPDAPSTSGGSRGEDTLTTITLLTPGDDYLLSPLGYLPEMHFISDPLSLIMRERTLQEDGRTWLYRLRSGIRWHDGASFTTRDIEFSSAFYRHPDVAMEDPTAASLTVLDDSTFTITVHKGPAGITYGVYLPAHILAGRDPANRHQWSYWREPVGYGPFRYVRTQSGEFIELEANPDYHLGKPRIDRVVLKLGGNPLSELMAENVDGAYVSRPEARVLENDPRFQVYWVAATKLTHLYWNHRHPALADRRVRKALTLAIDRVGLARALDFPEDYFQTRPRDVYATESQVEGEEYPDVIPFDTVSAAALLDEAGWQDQNGDGLRERNGVPLRFHVMANEARHPIAVVLQSQWRRIGAEAVLYVIDESVALARVGEGDFEAFISSGNWGNAKKALTNSGSRHAQSGYANPVFDSLIALVDSVYPGKVEGEVMRAIWPILHEEVPVTLLLPQGYQAFVAHRRVRGVEGRSSEPMANLPWMWIDQDWEESLKGTGEGSR